MNPTDRAAVYRTAYDDYPTIVCSCGVSLHDDPGYAGRPSSRAAHETYWHSPEIPASYRSATGEPA